MQDMDDNALLREYVERESEEAFATLVARHINKVYSVALRHTGNPSEAEEITQAVFVILAKKSRGLRKGVILSGWLYQTARLTSVTFIRSEVRRARRQQEALMQNAVNESDAEAWGQIAPLLDAAMAKLNENDRHAVVLRFFDQKSMKEVGSAMGATEDAAKKRVTRALEKLRKYFSKHGVGSTTAIIANAISANSVQIAPMSLAKATVAVAVAKNSAVGGSTLTLIKGALKVMAWMKAKTVVAVSVGILLAAGTTTVVVERAVAGTKSFSSDPSWADDPGKWEMGSSVLDSLPPAFILRPTRFEGRGGSVSSGQRYLARDAAVQSIVAIAYDFLETRIVYPPDMTTNRFDLLMTMPGDHKQLLQDEIKKRFGLVAHKENREADIFRLKVSNPNPPNLKLHDGGEGEASWIRGGPGRYGVTTKNLRLDGFVTSIEYKMKQPVLDETGLTGRYDLQIDWQPKAGESTQDAFRRALLEQLGLELVPDRASIEELIVEKAK